MHSRQFPILNLYKDLISLRKANPALFRGWYCRYELFESNVLGFTREQEGVAEKFLILVNLDDETKTFKLNKAFQEIDANILEGAVIENGNVKMDAYGFVVASYKSDDYEFKNNEFCWVSQRVNLKNGMEMKVKDDL